MLQGAWKAADLDCKYEDDEGTISLWIVTVQKSLTTCVTLTNKSSLGSRALTKAQNNIGLKPHKMCTPIKTWWEYLIDALQCLIENRAAIDYMYGPMAGVGGNIKRQIPKWMDWEVSITVVHTMKNIVECIKLNQTKVEEWMLSQAVKELLELYISISKATVPKIVQKQIEAICSTYIEDDQEVRHFFQ